MILLETLRIRVPKTLVKEESSRLIMKRYASPGGGAIINAHETMYCVKSPASGALNGLLLAKNEGYGRMPSRPSSWMTRDCQP